MALGAQQSRVLRTVLGEVIILIGIGLGIGLAATLGATHFIASFYTASGKTIHGRFL